MAAFYIGSGQLPSGEALVGILDCAVRRSQVGAICRATRCNPEGTASGGATDGAALVDVHRH